MLTEQEMGQKKLQKKKKKQKKKNEGEEQSKPIETASAFLSSRDQATLDLGRKKKKAKALRDKGEERSGGVIASIEEIREAKKKSGTDSHSRAQEDGGHNIHVDHNAAFDGTKRERKKVRFYDQVASCNCQQNQPEEVCSHNNNVFEDSTANCCEDQAQSSPLSSRKKDNHKEAAARDESMSLNVGKARQATDEEASSSLKRPRDEDNVVWGKRFTLEEDEVLKNAVLEYVKSKGWDEQEGLNRVFNSQKHKDARNCWADIKSALPHRPRAAIRFRAHLLLEKGAHAGKWSEEEEQLLIRLQGEHGRKWRQVSSMIGRHRTSIKEKWRSLKRGKSTGAWTQGEIQQLSDLVHKCLRAKALIQLERKQPDHHILRDDINWEKIADTIGTHSHGSCCGKWYYNLQSSLVKDGVWANEDDLLLLESLLESGACSEEEVEWDSLLGHRSGQLCLTRWKQMVKQLGENRTREFMDKLDVLARRFAPELFESSSVTESPSATARTINES